MIYVYTNDVKADSVDTMQNHTGTVILDYKNGKLDGNYYTGRGRETIGTMSLKKPKKTKKRKRVRSDYFPKKIKVA